MRARTHVNEGLLDRVALASLPTPLEPMARLGHELQMHPDCLWVKRDDLAGRGGGGNKARKLEYLCAAAIAAGADTLITCGTAQSNHARMTAAAGAQLGLRTVLVLVGEPQDEPGGNVACDLMLGAEVVWCTGARLEDLPGAVAQVAAKLRGDGWVPFTIPLGGSTPLGVCGAASCGHELRTQASGVDTVVVATGSGGTHAGISVAFGDHRRVLGIDVGAVSDPDAVVRRLAVEASEVLGVRSPINAVRIDHTQTGAGYGVPTPAAAEAINMAARLEGLLLDPVYTGKAMAGLIDARRRGEISAGDGVVFVHTGGIPSLFPSQILARPRRSGQQL